MKTYVPFLRGKQNEMMALRELAASIAESGNVLPLIEPVKGNATTRISIDRFVQASMPFILICNPQYGDFSSNHTFLDRFDEVEVAVIYWGLPDNQSARSLLSSSNVTRHVFLGDRVATEYVNSINLRQRTIITDQFFRRPRNADYPPREFFTDMNTLTGNPNRLDFGDFSIVGNYYADSGGPTFAVALHHIHFQDNQAGPLNISHFISDRTETAADPGGKTMEALAKLVAAIDGGLMPNTTSACVEYREMLEDQNFRGLGYMKKMAIMHHLEVMLNGGIQL